MKGRSTITQLLLYLAEIYKARDKDDDIFCLYLDFSKSFDCFQHSILLNKLGSFEIGGNLLRLLASHLKNRTVSRLKIVYLVFMGIRFKRVPQGSIL